MKSTWGSLHAKCVTGRSAGGFGLRAKLLAGLALLLALAGAREVRAQATDDYWTQVRGGPFLQANKPGVYGTLGTPATTNTPGGRLGAVSGEDGAGNFLLFGGRGYDSAGNLGLLNDLWEFNTSTKEWTWMSGSSTFPANCETTDTCVAPGVYGTLGVPAPGNVPGSRFDAVGGSDRSGNLWIFGGGVYFESNGSPGYLSDLWKFNTSTKEWTWMSGSSTFPANCETTGACAAPGVYGTLGVPAPGNAPGGRGYAASWIDSSGDFWLFGGHGFGYDSAKGFGNLNDLWEFNPSTGQWAWMGGSNTVDQTAVFGTQGTPAAGNGPGGLEATAFWVDNNGNFWLFGGFGSVPADIGSFGVLNNLWEFNPSTLQWTWVNGSQNSAPTYGQSATTALPGLTGSVGWADNAGNFWLFGGAAESDQCEADVDDLWEFSLATEQWETPTINNFGPFPRDSGNGWTDSRGNLWLFGGASESSECEFYGELNDLWEYQTAPLTATPVFSPAPGAYSTAQTVTISDTTDGSTIYYTTDGTTPTTASAVYGGPVSVPANVTVLAIAAAPNDELSYTATGTYIISVPQTISFPSIPTQSVGTPLALTAVATSGLPVSFYSTKTAVCSVSGTAATFIAAGTCSINATQAGNSYYKAAQTVGTSFIVGASQTITFPAITTAEYSGTSTPLLATASSGLAVKFASTTSSACTVSGTTASLLAAGTCTIEATQAGNNLTFGPASPVSQSFTVSPAQSAQTIAFAAIANQLEGANVTLAATASSGLAVSFASTTPAVCSVSGTSATLLSLGTCTVDATQAGNSTYAPAATVARSFYSRTTQTITYAPIAAQAVGTTLTLSAAASSGLAVTFTSTKPAVCTVSGNTASFIATGTCSIDFTQAGSSDYVAATPVGTSFIVGLGQTITFPAITGPQYAASNIALSATASSGLAVAFSSTTPTVCAAEGMTASLFTAGTCTIQATQSGANSAYAPAVPVLQSFTVTKASQTITFAKIATQTVGATINLVATASSGLAITYRATTPSVCSTSGSTATMLSAGTCSIDFTQNGDAEYAQATPVGTSFIVNP
jgi:Chitobiase/beta-hexosaminidase C-terminal domain/Galactose oxidase, central domain